MLKVDTGYFLRFLSFIYAHIWVPIRLTYLRVKFNIIPKMKSCFETSFIMIILIFIAPFVIIYVMFKDVEELISFWIETAHYSYSLRRMKPPSQQHNNTDTSKETPTDTPKNNS